jgi:hypothetical protein
MYESNKKIQDIATKAAEKAVESAIKNRVPITYISGSEVIRESPDGSKEILEVLPPNIQPTQKRFKI